jgi:hypothetical protein
MSSNYTPINNYTFGKFKGSDNVSVGTDVGVKINGSASFSIDAWVKFDGLCDGGNIISQDSNFSLSISGKDIIFQLDGYPPVSSSGSDMPLNIDDWFYIVVTYDQAQVLIYINGHVAAQQIIRGTPSTTSSTAKIGKNLQGDIRRVMVYPNTLNSAGVLANMYNPPSSGYCTWVDLTSNPPTEKSSNHWPLTSTYTPIRQIPSVVMPATGYVKPVQVNDEINPGGGGTGNDAYTIMATVNTNMHAPKQVVLLNSDNEGSNGISLWLDTDTSGDKFVLKATHGTLDGVSDTVTSTTKLDVDSWYNIAVSYDTNKNIKLYINGVFDASDSVTTAVPLTDNVITIGCAFKEGRPTGAYSFRGHIQNLSIWNTALSAADISSASTGGSNSVSSTSLKANFGFDIPPIRNNVNGTTVGLCDGANWEIFTESLTLLPSSTEATEQIALDSTLDEKNIDLDEETLAKFRKEATQGDYTSQFKDAKKEDIEHGLKSIIPAKYLEKTKKLIGKEWDDVIEKVNKEGHGSHGVISWHKTATHDVLIHHYKDHSEILYTAILGSIDSCTMWKIQFFWTVFMGLMSVLGVTATLTDKAKTYIQTNILNNQPLLRVIAQNTNNVTASGFFTMIYGLYSFGVLWPLIKIIFKSLGWWALTSLLIKIGSYFVGAGIATLVARLVVAAAQLIIVISNRPNNCSLSA